jgi:hypothetical protein
MKRKCRASVGAVCLMRSEILDMRVTVSECKHNCILTCFDYLVWLLVVKSYFAADGEMN